MTKSKGRRRKSSRRFETARAVVLGRALAPGRASAPSRADAAPPGRRLRVIGGLAIAVVVAGALWLTVDARFYVLRADVMGVKQVSPAEVFQASGLERIHVLWVRPAQVEARLVAALPSIERAQVSCGLPAKCTITVTERQPRLVWEEDGQSWWIDAQGVVFPPSLSLPSAGGDAGGAVGWTVRGPLPRDEDGHLDEGVRVALNELWAAGMDISSSLTYIPGRGLVLTDEHGWRVILGEGPGMRERLQVLRWLQADLEGRGLSPRFVDVRLPDAPYYSLTNEW